MASEDPFNIPLIIRGEIIDDYSREFGGRRGGVSFRTADVGKVLDKLILRTPSKMADLYTLKFDDILDYLEELGGRLNLKNPYLAQAFELSCRTSGLSESVLRALYEGLHRGFGRANLRESAERACGIDRLEGWVEMPKMTDAPGSVRVRAFGSRAVHVIAGNVPRVAASTIIRNALTRSDCIIKTPSNDPLTATAIARTMVEMAPDHPLTRHVSVAYWKGGDEAVEQGIYDPRGIEKIVAWGGFDSIKHVTRYLQPGIDLVTLDPKLSGTIIGRDGLKDEETMRHVAKRLALDIGVLNQEACVNARVVYVEADESDADMEKCCRLAALTLEAMQRLPDTLSTPHKDFDPTLREEIDGLKFIEEDYEIFGGRGNEGAIIVSKNGAPVDFARILACRVANIVPVPDLEIAIRSVNSYTQTIGIYPEELKIDLRDRLAFQGAQRLVSLGAAATLPQNTEIQDGIEPMRRICKWIIETVGPPEYFEELTR